MFLHALTAEGRRSTWHTVAMMILWLFYQTHYPMSTFIDGIMVVMTKDQTLSLMHLSKQRLSVINVWTNPLYTCASLIPGGQIQRISPATLLEQVPPFLQKSTSDAHADTDLEQFLPER